VKVKVKAKVKVKVKVKAKEKERVKVKVKVKVVVPCRLRATGSQGVVAQAIFSLWEWPRLHSHSGERPASGRRNSQNSTSDLNTKGRQDNPACSFRIERE
jgi:hypothetical protein